MIHCTTLRDFSLSEKLNMIKEDRFCFSSHFNLIKMVSSFHCRLQNYTLQDVYNITWWFVDGYISNTINCKRRKQFTLLSQTTFSTRPKCCLPWTLATAHQNNTLGHPQPHLEALVLLLTLSQKIASLEPKSLLHSYSADFFFNSFFLL